MKLKKAIGLTLALITTAGALSGVLPLSASADGSSVRAGETVTLNEENAILHLPDSYEQYLPLENPTYVAMNEAYIAVADNSSIYIYDRAEDKYRRYEHEPNSLSMAVSKIQFSDEGEMFFRDAENHLYRYHFDSDSATIIDNISCQTFLIHGKYLYYVTETPTAGRSDFFYVPVNSDELKFENREILAKDIAASNPRMAFENDTLYCIINNNTVNAYSSTTHEFVSGSTLDRTCPEVANLQFVCAYGDELFYTVKGTGNANNGLWRTDLYGNAERVLEGDDYSTITSYGDMLYCIQGNAIREMMVTENSVEPTGYEIAIDSSSPHRLANSNETVRTKDLVVIADTSNRRLSVYNRLDGSYSIIPCTDGSNVFVPEHVAIGKEEVEVKTNGDTVTRNKIAVSNGNKIYEYTFERHTLKTEENGAREPQLYTALQNVKGLTYVYGECYYITDYYGYGTLSNPTVGELHFSDEQSSPDAITSDIYGTIYVAFGNRVYSFKEADFLKDGAIGTHVITLSGASDKVYTSLNVDYEGNVWHLSDQGILYCNNVVKATVDGKDFVYLNEEHAYPVSFALCFEDDEIYFNFQNYVVKTNPYALASLPSLNKITAGEAKTKVFELADTSNLFVTVPAGSVGFEIALDALKSGESEYFPYESYFRLEGETDSARRGVLLYEPTSADGYYVVALYNSDLRTFTANLFKKSKNNILPAEDCFTEADEVAYITSDVSLCSAPCLFPAPKGERLSTLSDSLLERGTIIKVLGYAEGEDRTYAYIEVIDNARTTLRGFVPRSYLTKNDPLGVSEQKYFLGYLKANAGIKLVSADGKELEITQKMQAKLYKNEDGNYTAVVEKDGVVYTGIVKSENIARGETDALRISLIVILSVLALVIIGGYVFLMFPRKKKKK